MAMYSVFSTRLPLATGLFFVSTAARTYRLCLCSNVRRYLGLRAREHGRDRHVSAHLVLLQTWSVSVGSSLREAGDKCELALKRPQHLPSRRWQRRAGDTGEMRLHLQGLHAKWCQLPLVNLRLPTERSIPMSPIYHPLTVQSASAVTPSSSNTFAGKRPPSTTTGR